MSTINKSLNRADNIFATLTLQGKTLVTLYRNQFNSITEIINAIKEIFPGLEGLGQLSIRNQTQGWNADLCLLFKSNKNKTNLNIVPPHDGRQYLIPWA